MMSTDQSNKSKYWQYALWLACFTISYNIVEGLVSIYFGAEDEALTLFGFGMDSFIEVLSGVGIFTMILRIRKNPDQPRSSFERTALRVTGTSFYLLAAGLGISAILNLLTGHKPESTLPGLIISIISIMTMWALAAAKQKVGYALDSPPIIADSRCTLVCLYMSLVLLAASIVYQLTGFGFIDSLGALGLIYFSITEGREAFEKANGMEECCKCSKCAG